MTGDTPLYVGRWRALLVPLCSPGCTCPTPGKSPHPEGRGWQERARRRFEEYTEQTAEAHVTRVREHVRRGGNLGLAIPAHTAALDCDTDLEGCDQYDGPLARDGIEVLCPDHPLQESGKTDTGGPDGRRVGVHVVGGIRDERVYATHYGNVPVTIRHVGNQIAVAPSLHRSGVQYEWLRELPEDPTQLPAFDMSLFRYISKARDGECIVRAADEDEAAWRKRVAAAWRREIEDPEACFAPGRRHEAMLRAGWLLTVRGAPEAEIRAALLDLAERRCSAEGRFAAPEGSPERRALEREIEGIIRSCARRYTAWAQTVEPVESPQRFDGRLPSRVAKLLRTDRRVRERFRRRPARGGTRSGDGLDLSLAGLLARRGLPEAEIEAALRASRARAGLPERPPHYFEATAGKALAGTAS